MNKQAEHLNLVGHKSKWKNIHKFVLCIIDMHNNHFHIIKPIAAFDYSLTSFIVGISVFFVMSFILILNTQFGDPQVDTTVSIPLTTKQFILKIIMKIVMELLACWD